MANKIRAIAFYLPQFHPTHQNDMWWGKGFTEWTNVGRAKPLYPGHYQPRVPADLGYYDLRLPQVRAAQAEMAREYGIEGFCYWHYWFGNGRMMLEKPFEEVLRLGEPDFPFCVGWANHSWKKKLWSDNGESDGDQMLLEQTYPGDRDHIAHFNYLLPAFRDKRYIRVDGKPLFVVFEPPQMPDPKGFIELWNRLAEENGLGGIYFVGQGYNHRRDEILEMGFDAFSNYGSMYIHFKRSLIRRKLKSRVRKILRIPTVYSYRNAMKYNCCEHDGEQDTIPNVCPNWDHSPRSGRKGRVMHGSTPELFAEHVDRVFSRIKNKTYDKRLVFIKSWNEWGEGNYMEPDLKFGRGYLEAFRRVMDKYNELLKD